MKELLNLVDEIQCDIFALEFNKCLSKINELTILVEKNITKVENGNEQYIFNTINFLNQAIINRDFLLLADLLEYELKYYFTNKTDEVIH